MNSRYNHYDVRDLAHNSHKSVNFFCAAPQARTTELEGDFTDWQPVPMTRWVDGWWTVQVEIYDGPHEYRFLLDGLPMLESGSTSVGRKESDEPVWVIEA